VTGIAVVPAFIVDRNIFPSPDIRYGMRLGNFLINFGFSEVAGIYAVLFIANNPVLNTVATVIVFTLPSFGFVAVITLLIAVRNYGMELVDSRKGGTAVQFVIGAIAGLLLSIVGMSFHYMLCFGIQAYSHT